MCGNLNIPTGLWTTSVSKADFELGAEGSVCWKESQQHLRCEELHALACAQVLLLETDTASARSVGTMYEIRKPTG